MLEFDHMNSQLTEKWVKTGAIETFYLEGGEQDKQALIFLHGWGIRAKTFEASLLELAKHFHIFAPDLPGLGSTADISSIATYPQYADFCAQFMDSVNVQHAHILGHSFGGGVSAATAALHPNRIDSLVLLNSAGIPLPPIHTLAFPRLKEVFLQAARTSFAPVNLYVIKDFLSSWAFRPLTTSQTMYIPIMQDLRPLLPKISAPCLIAWGRHDCIIPVESAQMFNNLIKDSQLAVIDDGYHEWSVVQPKKFVGIVREFYRHHHFFSSEYIN